MIISTVPLRIYVHFIYDMLSSFYVKANATSAKLLHITE